MKVLRQCPYSDAAVHQNRDTVANCLQAVQVMGYHENRQPQTISEAQNQLIEAGGGNRIKPRGRLV